MGRIDVYIQAETSMNFRCYFSLQEFQNSSFVQAKTGFQESEHKKGGCIKVFNDTTSFFYTRFKTCQ